MFESLVALEILLPTESVVGAKQKIKEIRTIIEKYGWFDQPAIVIKDETDGMFYLLDGHHRFAAAQEIGLEEIPVLIVEFSELPEFHLFYNSIEDIRRASNNMERFR